MTEEISFVVTLDALAAVQLAGRTKGEAVPISLTEKDKTCGRFVSDSK